MQLQHINNDGIDLKFKSTVRANMYFLNILYINLTAFAFMNCLNWSEHLKIQAESTFSHISGLSIENKHWITHEKPARNGLSIRHIFKRDSNSISDLKNLNSSSSNSNTTSYVTYSTPTAIILAILTLIVSLTTIIGNILVIIAFIVERALRTTSNYYLASLAVTDVLIGFFSMNLYTLYLILGHWPLGRLSCDLWLSLDYTACLTSQYTVFLITIDRFCSVHLPAKYRNWRTDRKILILVAVTWIVPSCVFFITIMGWPYFNKQIVPRSQHECYAEFSNDPIFNTVFTVCYFWITLFVMIGLYVGIYRVAVDLQKRSDEKRNRVSGLINKTKDQPDLDKAFISKANPEKMITETFKHVNPGNILSLKVNKKMSRYQPGQTDSSGFDSDEENCVKKISPTKTEAHLDGNKPDANVNKRPLFQNIAPRSDEQLNRELIINIPAKVEVKRNFKPELSDYETMPPSVSLHEIKGIVISSPILTDDDDDDDSEKEIRHSLTNKINSTSIPVLTCCVTTVATQATPPTTLTTTSTFTTVNKTNLPMNHSNEDGQNLSSMLDEIVNKGKKDKDEEEDNVDMKSDSPPLDPGYQDRVLQQFQQRMAAMNKTKQNSVIQSKRQSTNQSLLTVNNLNISESNSSKETSTPNYICNGKFNFMTSKSNIQYSSPVWKSRPCTNDGVCSLTSCQYCTYCSITDDCLINPECALCMKQIDSDTLQSSSSYGDFIGLTDCDHKCMCNLDRKYRKKLSLIKRLQINFNQLRTKSNNSKLLENIKEKILSTTSTRRNSQKSIERGRRENRARKALRTITFILGAFVFCWTPYHVVIIIKGICDNAELKYTCVNDIFYSITYWLCYMNSPINPFCYALANAQFKKTFLRILTGDLRRT